MANIDQIPDDVSGDVAAELRARTARKQIRQQAIAEAMGMSQSSISEKWRGLVPLTVSQFVAWCHAIGDHPSDVLRAALEGSNVITLHDSASSRRRQGIGSVTGRREDAYDAAAADEDDTGDGTDADFDNA